MGGTIGILTISNPWPMLYLNNPDIIKGDNSLSQPVSAPIRITDKNNASLSEFSSFISNNLIQTSMVACRNVTGSNDYSLISVVQPNEGNGYATSPVTPDNSVANEIITANYFNANTIRKITGQDIIYVGGNNASDTADLYAGRGFSEDKPFLTLTAALNWIGANCITNAGVGIIIKADTTLSGNFYLPYLTGIWITSETGTTITLTSNVIVYSGFMTFNNCNLNLGSYFINNYGLGSNLTGTRYYGSGNNIIANNSNYIFHAQGPSALIWLEGAITINGNVTGSVAMVTDRATLYSTRSCSLSGNITGKRYILRKCACMITNGKDKNFIPGNQAGEMDDNCFYC